MLERRAPLRRGRCGFRPVQITDQIPFAISFDPIAQDQIMHSAADIDGIELDESEVVKRSADSRDRRIEQDRAAMKPARI